MKKAAILLVFGLVLTGTSFVSAQTVLENPPGPEEIFNLLQPINPNLPNQNQDQNVFEFQNDPLENLQSDLGEITLFEDQIKVTVTPEFPRANRNIQIRLESFTTDLDRSTIRWFLNGSLIDEGRGQKDGGFKTGNIGQTSTLRIVIIKPDGEVIERSYSFTPAEVDLIYEANTVTPPFYKGKAIPTSQSSINLIAQSYFGSATSEDQIIYTWEINGTVDGKNSGVGKNTYLYQDDILSDPITVELQAETVNSSQKAKTTRTITFERPTVLIYEKNPIFGTIFDKAVAGRFILDRAEVEFEAVPYFFDKETVNSEYRWRINGELIDQDFTNTITFRRVDDKPGVANIDLTLGKVGKILQSAESSFSLLYDEGTREFEF